MLDCPTNKECVQQTCCGIRQLKEGAKNGIKNLGACAADPQSPDASQALLTNNKKSNSKLDKLENIVIDMIEQPGDSKDEQKERKDDV